MAVEIQVFGVCIWKILPVDMCSNYKKFHLKIRFLNSSIQLYS